MPWVGSVFPVIYDVRPVIREIGECGRRILLGDSFRKIGFRRGGRGPAVSAGARAGTCRSSPWGFIVLFAPCTFLRRSDYFPARRNNQLMNFHTH